MPISILRFGLRAAKTEKRENLWGFIRFDAQAARAGIKLKGLAPLNEIMRYA